MKYFLKRILIFVLFPAIALSTLAIWYSKVLPAPKISNRYSFNEKVFHFDDFDADYLTIGSSMALNNFNSEEVVNELSTKKYFNFACWGVKPIDDYHLLRIYLSKYNPKYIFYISNVMDFLTPLLPLEENQIETRILYPNQILIPYYYLTHLDLKYYFKYSKLNQLYKYCDTISQSIKFDEYGGVSLIANRIPYVNSQYWVNELEFDQISEENYEYLEKILELLAKKDIRFVFIQTPLREGLLDDEYRKNINIHVSKVKSIVENYGQLYINSTEKIWPDTMFFDYAHFNKRGSEEFTRYCLNKIARHYRWDSANALSNEIEDEKHNLATMVK